MPHFNFLPGVVLGSECNVDLERSRREPYTTRHSYYGGDYVVYFLCWEVEMGGGRGRGEISIPGVCCTHSSLSVCPNSWKENEAVSAVWILTDYAESFR